MFKNDFLDILFLTRMFFLCTQYLLILIVYIEFNEYVAIFEPGGTIRRLTLGAIFDDFMEEREKERKRGEKKTLSVQRIEITRKRNNMMMKKEKK